MKQFDEPTQLITSELALDLNKRYNEKRSGLILSNIGKEDTNAVWYSIEELENYINYIKTKGIEKGIEINGIRFYIGVYPEDGLKYKEKAGLTTIFLSPTKKKISGNLEKSLDANTSVEVNVDVTEIEPLNYGGIGNPPKITYPQ